MRTFASHADWDIAVLPVHHRDEIRTGHIHNAVSRNFATPRPLECKSYSAPSDVVLCVHRYFGGL